MNNEDDNEFKLFLILKFGNIDITDEGTIARIKAETNEKLIWQWIINCQALLEHIDSFGIGKKINLLVQNLIDGKIDIEEFNNEHISLKENEYNTPHTTIISKLISEIFMYTNEYILGIENTVGIEHFISGYGLDNNILTNLLIDELKKFYNSNCDLHS